MGGDCIPSEVIQYQDAFQNLDKTNCGMLPTKLLGQLLRFVERTLVMLRFRS